MAEWGAKGGGELQMTGNPVKPGEKEETNKTKPVHMQELSPSSAEPGRADQDRVPKIYSS